jgi:hypothetical protein
VNNAHCIRKTGHYTCTEVQECFASLSPLKIAAFKFTRGIYHLYAELSGPFLIPIPSASGLMDSSHALLGDSQLF